MSHTPRKIGNLLRCSDTFGPLRLELDQQSIVARRVRSALEPEASAHLITARIKANELVLYVDSPAWATRLRLQGPELLRLLRGQPFAARKVHTRVVVAHKMRPVVATATLSKSARLAFAEAAEGVTDHDLKASLLRLSELDTTTQGSVE